MNANFQVKYKKNLRISKRFDENHRWKNHWVFKKNLKKNRIFKLLETSSFMVEHWGFSLSKFHYFFAFPNHAYTPTQPPDSRICKQSSKVVNSIFLIMYDRRAPRMYPLGRWASVASYKHQQTLQSNHLSFITQSTPFSHSFVRFWSPGHKIRLHNVARGRARGYFFSTQGQRFLCSRI